MKKFRLVWRIELERIVKAKDEKDAKNIAENIDCQHDGSYVTDSWELVKATELTKADLEFIRESRCVPESF